MSTVIKTLAHLPTQERLRVLQRLRSEKLPSVRLAQPSEPELRRVDAPSPPASYWQEQMWYLEQLTPNTATYNVPFRFNLTGKLDIGALKATLTEIERRHDALRTTLTYRGGSLIQSIAKPSPVQLPIVDVSDQTDPDLAASEAVRAFAEIPAGLIKGPAYRVQLLRIDEERHVLVWIASHAIADGWSLGVLVRELAALYPVFARGEQPNLAPLPLQFGDYAVWQRELLSGERLQTLLEYWKRCFSGYEPSRFESDFGRPAVQSTRGKTLNFVIPQATAEKISLLGRRHGMTSFMTLLAAYQLLLSRRSGREEAVVATPVTGRSHAALEQLIGSFVNVLPIRTPLQGAKSFVEVLPRVREATLGAFAHQEVPFGRLVQALAPTRDASRNPLCQSLFLFGSTPLLEREVQLSSELSLAWDGISTSTCKFDFDLAIDEHADGFHGRFDYCVDLFKAETAAEICDQYSALLARIAERPDQPIAGLLPTALVVRQREPEPHTRDRETVLAAPRATTHTEVLVAEAWSRALGVEPVRRSDDFFALGGHSVLAARVVAQLREQFHVELTLPAFLRHTSVAAVSALIDRLAAGEPADTREPSPSAQSDSESEKLRLLERIERMSEDEVAVLLGAESEPEPDDDLRDRVAAAWQEILQVEGISEHDDFFGRGGHSVLAAQLVARLRETLDVEFTLPEFLADTTFSGSLATLTRRLAAADGTKRPSTTVTNASSRVQHTEDLDSEWIQ